MSVIKNVSEDVSKDEQGSISFKILDSPFDSFNHYCSHVVRAGPPVCFQSLPGLPPRIMEVRKITFDHAMFVHLKRLHFLFEIFGVCAVCVCVLVFESVCLLVSVSVCLCVYVCVMVCVRVSMC